MYLKKNENDRKYEYEKPMEWGYAPNARDFKGATAYKVWKRIRTTYELAI
jgi:hypothetical protein